MMNGMMHGMTPFGSVFAWCGWYPGSPLGLISTLLPLIAIGAIVYLVTKRPQTAGLHES